MGSAPSVSIRFNDGDICLFSEAITQQGFNMFALQRSDEENGGPKGVEQGKKKRGGNITVISHQSLASIKLAQ